MRVLVTGAAGLLGAAIVREFATNHEVTACGRRELDISQAAAVRAAFTSARPDVVINCAAYNDVDGAEESPAAALEVNAYGVLSLAQAAAERGAMLVHYSTDFVFDGRASAPYTETDEPNPRGAYAAAKLLGDLFALDYGKAWVLRVESLFGTPAAVATRVGSLGTMVRRIQAGEEVPVFVDRTVSPSYTADVASATRALLERQVRYGLYHCVNSGAATWSEVAEEAARLLGRPLKMKPITLATAALRAPRPKYCALSNAKLAAEGIAMPIWRDAMQRHLRGARISRSM